MQTASARVALAPAEGTAELTLLDGGYDVGARRLSTYQAAVKPVVDRSLATLLLVLLSPILGVVALAILVTLGRPVFIRQQRVGEHGHHFKMWKFRTMRPCRRDPRLVDGYDGEDRRRSHKTDDDPRHTNLGRLLRKLSLDELPQLINVLTGDMSLVGPRPELPVIVAGYEAWQHERHAVKPGVTGLWQVTARETAGQMHRHTHIDVEYVRSISFAADMRILLLTVPVLLGVRAGR